MGQGKVRYSHPGLFLDGGCESGDELQVPLGFLGVQVVLIICYFASLCFVNNAVYCGFVKVLIPKGKVSHFFNLFEALPALESPATKSLTLVTVQFWEGWQR